MIFKFIRIISAAIGVFMAIYIGIIIPVILLSAGFYTRVLIPFMTLSFCLCNMFFLHQETVFFYLQNHPNEEDLILKSAGLMRVKEDTVRTYPNEKIQKLFQGFITISMCSFVWVVIEIIIDANK